MRLLRSLISSFAKINTAAAPAKRNFAQVHDVQITFEKGKAAAGFRQESEGAPERGTMADRNVFQQPLAIHGTRPLAGYMRTGYCEAPRSDYGNHSIAGIVTNEFLDFSASRGNDLRSAGLTDGCKWCLCVSRWKEAFDARTGDDDRKVPKVVLKATNERALTRVTLEELKKFAVDKEDK